MEDEFLVIKLWEAFITFLVTKKRVKVLSGDTLTTHKILLSDKSQDGKKKGCLITFTQSLDQPDSYL